MNLITKIGKLVHENSSAISHPLKGMIANVWYSCYKMCCCYNTNNTCKNACKYYF